MPESIISGVWFYCNISGIGSMLKSLLYRKALAASKHAKRLRHPSFSLEEKNTWYFKQNKPALARRTGEGTYNKQTVPICHSMDSSLHFFTDLLGSGEPPRANPITPTIHFYDGGNYTILVKVVYNIWKKQRRLADARSTGARGGFTYT